MDAKLAGGLSKRRAVEGGLGMVAEAEVSRHPLAKGVV
jgi:hypothetical protein